MEQLLVIGIIILFSGLIAWRWVEGIDYMQKNHPDYKGEDFLNWSNDDVTKSAGRDAWDDNNVHTENEF
jgi:hypothetical protein